MVNDRVRYRAKTSNWQVSALLFSCCIWVYSSISLSQTQAESHRLLVMGDSLSAAFNIPVESGWVNLLEKRLLESPKTSNWEVINASISGETTSGGIARLAALMEENEPDIVILELGANDGLQARPTQQIEENLQIMLDMIGTANARALLIGMRIPDNYGPIYQRSFAEIFTNINNANPAVLLVPFLLKDVASNLDLMQSDGLHPKADAQPLILDNVWPVLEPLIQ